MAASLTGWLRTTPLAVKSALIIWRTQATVAKPRPIFSEALERKVDYIVTTEKDAVRIPEGMPCPVPIYYLRLEIDILHGAANFDEAVGRICFPPSFPAGVGAVLPSASGGSTLAVS